MIDPTKFENATSMLGSKKFNFRVVLGSSGHGGLQSQTPSRLEDRLIVEDQLDSNGAFQTLGFRDPSNGNEGRFQLTDEATPRSRA